MAETTVSTDLLQALKVFTELGGNTVGQDLAVLAIDNVALPVEEPGGDLVYAAVSQGTSERGAAAAYTGGGSG